MELIIFYFVIGGIVFVVLFILLLKLYQKIQGKLQKKYIPDRASKFKCMDGHITRSKGEMIIDNLLYHFHIEHEYEKTIEVRGNSIKYDWYLPEFDLYIEYWGYFGKDYMARKDEKLKLYQKGDLDLISIEDVMLEDIYEYLVIELEKYIDIKIERFKDIEVLFCPNCGSKLDNRFQI
jgi:hypothetical protein